MLHKHKKWLSYPEIVLVAIHAIAPVALVVWAYKTGERSHHKRQPEEASSW